MNRALPRLASFIARYRAARPWLIAAFLALLAGVQLAALGEQFSEGFRPFARAPGRVPLSWDMFAQPIERCDLRWTPPLHAYGRDVHAMPELGPRFEWDAVLDRNEDYEELGLDACAQFGEPGTRVMLTCFLPEGRTIRREVPCP